MTQNYTVNVLEQRVRTETYNVRVASRDSVYSSGAGAYGTGCGGCGNYNACCN